MQREPNLTLPGPDSRLPLLIDALSAGAETFVSGSRKATRAELDDDEGDEVDEVGLVMRRRHKEEQLKAVLEGNGDGEDEEMADA